MNPKPPLMTASECVAALSERKVELNIIARAVGCSRQALYLWRRNDEGGEGGRRITRKNLEKLNRVTARFLAYCAHEPTPPTWTLKTFSDAVRAGAKLV